MNRERSQIEGGGADCNKNLYKIRGQFKKPCYEIHVLIKSFSKEF